MDKMHRFEVLDARCHVTFVQWRLLPNCGKWDKNETPMLLPSLDVLRPQSPAWRIIDNVFCTCSRLSSRAECGFYISVQVPTSGRIMPCAVMGRATDYTTDGDEHRQGAWSVRSLNPSLRKMLSCVYSASDAAVLVVPMY